MKKTIVTRQAPGLLPGLRNAILFLPLCMMLVFVLPGCKSTAANKTAPNIVIFYVDDLGYGDLGSYGGNMVQTPFLDSLCTSSIRFTDAHSSAATCTPSRYSLLTGEYAFRNAAAILPGDAPALIPGDKPTLPRMLQGAGYHTAVIGKWHLGLGDGNLDWNGNIAPGPLELGFDYCYLLPATGDRVPTVFVENHRVVNADPSDPIKVSYSQKLTGYPNGLDSPQLLRQPADSQHSNTIVNGISRIGYMQGGHKALWRDEEFPILFSQKAKDFIGQNKQNPFFLFFSFHDIHVPRVPNERFAGKSPLGPRGDAIAQMDWTIRQVMEYLKETGLLENTLVIVTSDNGPVLNDGYEDMSAEKVAGHKPWGPFRGGKYSAYEAGTRVPFIVSWPGKIAPQTSDALISQVDLYRSLASVVGVKVPATTAIDSEDQSDALLGKSSAGRDMMLEESFTLAVREGNWKYISPLPAHKKIPAFMANKGIESGANKQPQLYRLEDDPAEGRNLADSLPDRVQKMQGFIDEIINRTSARAPKQN